MYLYNFLSVILLFIKYYYCYTLSLFYTFNFQSIFRIYTTESHASSTIRLNFSVQLGEFVNR